MYLKNVQLIVCQLYCNKVIKTQEDYFLTAKLGGTFICIRRCMRAEKNKDNETVLVMQTGQQIISMPYNMMSISINICK